MHFMPTGLCTFVVPMILFFLHYVLCDKMKLVSGKRTLKRGEEARCVYLIFPNRITDKADHMICLHDHLNNLITPVIR